MSAIIELQITDAERKALMLALPLARNLVSTTPGNNQIFTIAAATSLKKLESHNFCFTFTEIRTMAVVLSIAVIICRGEKTNFLSPDTPESQWRALLLPHLLPLTRLESILGEFVSEHLDQ